MILIINAYKPSENFTNNFLKKAGVNLEKDFVKMHLENCRLNQILKEPNKCYFQSFLSQYIQNGFEVRMDASEFYGL